MTVFPSRKVAAPCRQYLKDGDGERVSEMSVGRQNDVLVVAEQVGAGDVMQLSIHPEQQVAVIVCTQTHTHVNWAAVAASPSAHSFCSRSRSRSRGSYISRLLERLPRTSQTTIAFCRMWVAAHCGPTPMTCGICSCREHVTNSVTGVSRPPVLDCVTTFHPDYTAGTYLRLFHTISEISPTIHPSIRPPRKVQPIWILQEQETVTVASAGPYASMHLAPDR